jgi:hypothetical protein
LAAIGKTIIPETWVPARRGTGYGFADRTRRLALFRRTLRICLKARRWPKMRDLAGFARLVLIKHRPTGVEIFGGQ